MSAPEGLQKYSERMCLLRALNSQMPQRSRVVEDPLAKKLLRWRWRLLLTLIRFGSLEQYVALEMDRRWPGGPIYGAIRSRMIDEMLEARLRRRYEQIVVLGAGMQTRAFRAHLYPAGVRLFEVDWPDEQAKKRHRLQVALGDRTESVAFAACDLTNGELVPALQACGFDSKARTIFLWEGATFALSQEAVETTLRSIHESTIPGSVLIFDFMDGRVVYDDYRPPGSEALLDYLRRLGMPPRFGIRPGKEVAYLKRRGFRCRRTYGPGDFAFWLDTHPFYRALTIPQLWYICESIVE